MNGKTFEQFKPGDRYVTGRRTITEHDILQFVGLVGLTEPLFLDLEYIRKESLYGERIAPGCLTFGMAEGLTVQTGIIHGTGMAFADDTHGWLITSAGGSSYSSRLSRSIVARNMPAAMRTTGTT